jgi:uncharacterized membrane protein (DUF373 family)
VDHVADETALWRTGFPTRTGNFLANLPLQAARSCKKAQQAMATLNKASATAVEQPEEGWVGAASSGFLWLEHAAYVALGIVLSLSAVLALGSAAVAFWQAVSSWSGDHGILRIIDRLLFALMLIEILHTVRASMKSGGLTCEPFLVVGLIASIRRVLVITLQSSESTNSSMTGDAERLFRASMLELAVLAVLIAVMVVAIWILHKARAKPVD